MRRPHGAARWLATLLAGVVCAAAQADVVISEIHYHPAGGDADGDATERLEFVELWNTGDAPVDLGGWTLSGIGLEFPTGIRIQTDERLLLVADAALFRTEFGLEPDLAYDGKLKNSGETLTLIDAAGETVFQFTYDDAPPWPVTPDGLGPSLELVDWTLEVDDPANWRASIDPAGHTAGRANSVGQTNSAGPRVISVTEPHGTLPHAPLEVTAEASGAASATLTYVIGFGDELTTPMTCTPLTESDNRFRATLPGQPAGTLVRYRLVFSGAGVVTSSPAADDTVRYRGTVIEDPALDTALPVLHWFMEPERYSAAIGHRFTDETEPAVVFADGQLIDATAVRVRGQTSRQWPKPSWKLIFPKGHRFDLGGRLPGAVDRLNLQSCYADKSYLREVLAWESMRAAGVAACDARHVRVQLNGSFFGLFVAVEQPDAQWATRLGLDDDAERLKAFGDLAPLSSGLSLAGRALVESYEDKGGTDPYADLDALITALANPDDDALERFLLREVDVPATLNYLAAQCVIHGNDHLAKNYYLYRDPARDARWVMHPWDLDLTFGRSATTEVLNDRLFVDHDRVGRGALSHPRFGDAGHTHLGGGYNRLIDAVLRSPRLRALYLRRLRTVADELLAPGRYEARIAELVAEIAPEAALDRARWGQYGRGQTLETAVGRLVDEYLPRRRRHLLTTHVRRGGVPRPPSPHPLIVINELHYHPADGGPGNGDEEFIELQNPSLTEDVDLSGWSLEGLGRTGDAYVLPGGSVIPRHGLALVVRDPAAFRAAYPDAADAGALVLGAYPGKLSNSGERIILRDRAGREVDAVEYTDEAPWPAAADGDGPSLTRRQRPGDGSDPAAWTTSSRSGGTPGRHADDGAASLGLPAVVDPGGAVPSIDLGRMNRMDGLGTQWPAGVLEFGIVGGRGTHRIRTNARADAFGIVRPGRHTWRRLVRQALRTGRPIRITLVDPATEERFDVAELPLAEPATPVLIAPTGGAELQPSGVVFRAEVGDARRAHVELATDAAFGRVITRARLRRGQIAVGSLWVRQHGRRLAREPAASGASSASGASGPRGYLRVVTRDAHGRTRASEPVAVFFPRVSSTDR